ncbi:MAG: hypothetical protein RR623_00755 [Bacilli bacterium]
MVNDEIFEKHIQTLLSYVSEDKRKEFYVALSKYTSDMCQYTLDEFTNTLKKDIRDNPIKYFENDSENSG